MLGVIFSLFFFILGTFEFFGHNNTQIALTLYLISAIFYVGFSIYFNGQIKQIISKNWKEAVYEALKSIAKQQNKTENNN